MPANDANLKRKLTNDELLKMEAAVTCLAQATNNAQAITLAHNLKMSKDIEEKRKWIVLFYVSCFQLLSFLNMGRDNTDDLEEFVKKLKTSFIQDLTSTVPNVRK